MEEISKIFGSLAEQLKGGHPWKFRKHDIEIAVGQIFWLGLEAPDH